MFHPTDSTFDLLVKLGILREQDIQAARQLFQVLEGNIAGINDANKISAGDNGIVADGQSENRVKLAEQQLSFDGNSHAAPNHGLSALSESPVGRAVLLAAALVGFKQDLGDSDVERLDVGEQKKIARGARVARANGRQTKNIKAITTVLAHLQVATLLARALFPEQISLTEDRLKHGMDSLSLPEQDQHDETGFQYNISADGKYSINPGKQSQGGTSRLDGASDEVNHLPFATGGYDAVEGAPEIQHAKTSQPTRDLTDAVGLAQRQKADTIARILDHTLPLQHAFDRLDQRVAQMEAQLRQTPYNGS